MLRRLHPVWAADGPFRGPFGASTPIWEAFRAISRPVRSAGNPSEKLAAGQRSCGNAASCLWDGTHHPRAFHGTHLQRRNPIPHDAHAGTTATPDGALLRHAYWRTVKPPCKGTVVLLHGRAEFIEKYFETVTHLREAGFDVCTFDWRGQVARAAWFATEKGLHRQFRQCNRSRDDNDQCGAARLPSAILHPGPLAWCAGGASGQHLR